MTAPSRGERGVSPSLNTFDNTGEVRATVLTVMGEVTHALTSEGSDASEDGTGRGTPIIAFSHTAGLDLQTSEDVTPSVLAGHDRMPSVSYEDPSQAADPLRSVVVRRLTPIEVERLQDLPDDWTAKGVLDDGRVKRMPDSARYRQCGNGLTTAIPETIMGRILEVEAAFAAGSAAPSLPLD